MPINTKNSYIPFNTKHHNPFHTKLFPYTVTQSSVCSGCPTKQLHSNQFAKQLYPNQYTKQIHFNQYTKEVHSNLYTKQ
jgi:hypothetical protein